MDVAVDIRKGSLTYGQHVACLLTGRDEDGVRIAEEIGSKAQCSEFTVRWPSILRTKRDSLMDLRCSQRPLYSSTSATISTLPQADGGISIKDDFLNIDWKIPTNEALLSEKDTLHACLKDFDSPFLIEDELYPEFL